jgi:hypothetical protein
MRILIPAGAIATILWFVGRPEYRHAAHGRQAGSVAAIAGAFLLLEIAVSVLAARRKARNAPRRAVPYAAPARRR